MKTLTLMMLLIALTNNVFAQSAVRIDKGEAAKFKGVLITEEKAIQLDKAQRSNLVLKDLQIAQEDIIKYHREDAKVARTELSRAKFSSFWGNVGSFALGVLVTSVSLSISQELRNLQRD